MCLYPSIDLKATGRNIARLRKERGLSVKQLQAYFGFEDPQAIYRWQWGKNLPSVDNLYALSALFEVPMNEILVSSKPKLDMTVCEQQAPACCSALSGAILRFTAPRHRLLNIPDRLTLPLSYPPPRPPVIEPVVQ